LKDGRQIIVALGKSSVVYGLDPDQEGKILWQQRMGKGGVSGGVIWGAAVDGENVYAANNDFDAKNPEQAGGLSAFELSSGRLVWFAPPLSCENKKPCRPSHAAAVASIPGVLFAGTMDGRMRAISTRDGKAIWEYDTARDYETVNGVKANGGSISHGGATIVGGMVYVTSGYSHHGGVIPGNALLAFSVDGK
jgi:polyvinyl alcohol dehydrogenase (cytochrome)